ncbi:hypothetical protein D3C76_1785630 [compost metagenome]
MEFATGTESAMHVRQIAPLPPVDVPGNAPATDAPVVDSQMAVAPPKASPQP